MTPAEHLAEAERLLVVAYSPGSTEWANQGQGIIQASIAHALIAAAAELGVPHAGTTTGGEPGAAPAAAG